MALKASFDWSGERVRKILKNNNKSQRVNGTKKGKIGTLSCLMDRSRNFLSVGDEMRYEEYRGIFLFNHHCDCYGVALTDYMWYGDDKYNINSYGKFIEIPMDNGARMKIEKL